MAFSVRSSFHFRLAHSAVAIVFFLFCVWLGYIAIIWLSSVYGSTIFLKHLKIICHHSSFILTTNMDPIAEKRCMTWLQKNDYLLYFEYSYIQSITWYWGLIAEYGHTAFRLQPRKVFSHNIIEWVYLFLVLKFITIRTALDASHLAN